MKKFAVALVFCSLLPASLIAHQPLFYQAKVPVIIKAGRLIDVRAGRVLENQGIVIVWCDME